METLKVGIREFRSQLPHYLLDAGRPVAITRHGEIIGYYIPSREIEQKTGAESLKVAASKLDALLKAAQLDEAEVLAEFNSKRHIK
ncbi:MAG: hypothetical protein GJU73_03445 [Ferrovum sp.]|jgi:antitoxin (DNA-binding transcriptional repressor) of toxin-antitoxin stability system|uniref:hypothetical protein n=1 Tax=Ferrovum sp. TaxID=2609467 RepID=UPI00262C6662|nr:hypothetical protein [Ferrovum sp.]MBW8066478.1 hypothetical protein [Ferrovum sp.]